MLRPGATGLRPGAGGGGGGGGGRFFEGCCDGATRFLRRLLARLLCTLSATSTIASTLRSTANSTNSKIVSRDIPSHRPSTPPQSDRYCVNYIQNNDKPHRHRLYCLANYRRREASLQSNPIFTVTRKPCCRKETARCRKCSFPLKFANNIHYKYKKD